MDYKTKKELFVSNLQGTTAFEICVLTSVAPVRTTLFLFEFSLKRQKTIERSGRMMMYGVLQSRLKMEYSSVFEFLCGGADDTCLYALLFFVYDSVRAYRRRLVSLTSRHPENERRGST